MSCVWPWTQFLQKSSRENRSHLLAGVACLSATYLFLKSVLYFFFLIRKPALGFDYPGSPQPGRQDPSRKWLFHVPPKQHPGLKVEAGGLLSSCCTGAVTVSRMPKAPTPAQGDIPNWYLGERMQQVPFWKPPELNRPKTEQKERKKNHCTVSPNLRKWSLGTEKELAWLSSPGSEQRLHLLRLPATLGEWNNNNKNLDLSSLTLPATSPE